MEKKLIFSQADMMYTVAGASVLTGIRVLHYFTVRDLNDSNFTV